MAGLLLAGHVAGSLLATWQGAVAVRTVQAPAMAITPPVALDERLVFSFDERILLVSLLLFALAEIFRRGTALEHEQSLVV
jgi:hypothetical protein